ncbi:hypothetical protein [Halomonas binhaiensis]|uniref:DUF4440 domain-containing protein n=1 Tax=Halomonas binhaiensis TaxID=2562282 RepID=A0A5C1NFK7_9GAMM|nr:hypothetical protein [Halomonas binhaiensis]QEM80987.1 hypothetical protein E4T21_05050 [Halomonas binhaiensis]
MQSRRELIAYHSVIEIHQWIEDVFTGKNEYDASLEKLLGSFSESFTMVTIGGQTANFSQVESLFHKNIGRFPDLRIAIDGYEMLLNAPHGVMCRYRETHHNAGEVLTRWSVVMIELDKDKPRWRYLHETKIAE